MFVVGGTSLLPGVAARLETELQVLASVGAAAFAAAPVPLSAASAVVFAAAIAVVPDAAAAATVHVAVLVGSAGASFFLLLRILLHAALL